MHSSTSKKHYGCLLNYSFAFTPNINEIVCIRFFHERKQVKKLTSSVNKFMLTYNVIKNMISTSTVKSIGWKYFTGKKKKKLFQNALLFEMWCIFYDSFINNEWQHKLIIWESIINFSSINFTSHIWLQKSYPLFFTSWVVHDS